MHMNSLSAQAGTDEKAVVSVNLMTPVGVFVTTQAAA